MTKDTDIIKDDGSNIHIAYDVLDVMMIEVTLEEKTKGSLSFLFGLIY